MLKLIPIFLEFLNFLCLKCQTHLTQNHFNVIHLAVNA